MTAKYLWLDLETTGLDERQCTILEVAARITDAELVVLAGCHYLVKHDLQSLMMSEWPWKQHTASGLLADLKNATDNLAVVDERLASFMAEHAPNGTLQLAGSSVHFDRAFLKLHMPKTYGALHYQQLDVSSFKIAIGWWPTLELPSQDRAHRAMADINNSLALAHFFKDSLTAR
jgi:oligoribonuclease